jgi:hypothetical protein
MLLVLIFPISTAASTGSQSSDPAVTSCESAVHTTYEAINSAAAIQNAIQSQEYVQGVEGSQNGTYESVFQIDRTVMPYPTCAEEVVSINVVFALYNETGGQKANLVISESPNLAVTGSSVQTGVKFVNHSPKWSGFQVQANSGATQPIYGAYSTFTQEAAQYPTGGCGNAGTCNFGTWVGLTDSSLAGNNHLAQDGTAGFCIVVTGSTCTATSYFAWYELLTAPAIQCTSITVTPGHSYYVETENEAVYGGYNYDYDFYIYDNSNGYSCSSYGNSYSQMTSPKYGEFILENVEVQANGWYEPLAAFDPVPFTYSYINTAGYWSTINNFIWGAYDMENAPGAYGICGTYVVNVNYGSGLGSYGDFTMTFVSSQYTPYYQYLC